MIAKLLRGIAGLIAATCAAYFVGSIANTQFVIGAHNVPVSIGDRLNMTMFDMSNMYLYMAMILIGFIVAFTIAALLKRALPLLARFAYPVAGAAALAVMLGIMYIQFQTVPISGARSTLGFIAQVIAGGIGGWVFARIAGVQRSA